jgi:hypothetical protein
MRRQCKTPHEHGSTDDLEIPIVSRGGRSFIQVRYKTGLTDGRRFIFCSQTLSRIKEASGKAP